MLVVAGLVLAVLAAFLTTVTGGGEDLPDSADTADVPTCVTEPSATTAGGSSATAAPDVPVVGRPTRLDIPAIGVSAEVVPVSLAGSTLVPPDDVSIVGWWDGGARAGESRGTVLLAGHTFSRGAGVFDDLGDLARGDVVVVATPRGDVVYRVAAVVEYTVERLAEVAPRLFSQDVSPQLVLATCSAFDGAHYDATTIVVAEPVD